MYNVKIGISHTITLFSTYNLPFIFLSSFLSFTIVPEEFRHKEET